MKSKLISMTRNNLLYLPVMVLNEVQSPNSRYNGNFFVVAVDQVTETSISTNAVGSTNWVQGVIAGQTGDPSTIILVEQGLNTVEIPDSVALDADLVETQYIVEMDNRFGKIRTTTGEQGGGAIASPSFIDDDNIASYYFSATQNGNYVATSWGDKINTNVPTVNSDLKRIKGPRGSQFKCMIASTIDLATSAYLFDTLGSSGFTIDTQPYNFIDSNLRIIGGTTGYTMDIPIRYIKKP
jgi:hypothetical protein